jgi:hypothetical protein
LYASNKGKKEGNETEKNIQLQQSELSLSDTILKKVVKTDEQWKRGLPLINIIFYVKRNRAPFSK